jgi:hypothetical protein
MDLFLQFHLMNAGELNVGVNLTRSPSNVIKSLIVDSGVIDGEIINCYLLLPCIGSGVCVN